jgi:hypothetical protein
MYPDLLGSSHTERRTQSTARKLTFSVSEISPSELALARSKSLNFQHFHPILCSVIETLTLPVGGPNPIEPAFKTGAGSKPAPTFFN